MDESIIIIEDNKGVSASIVSMLKRNGFSTLTQVFNRDEAIEALTRNYFDIAIIDLNLEGENVPLPEWRDTGGVHILKLLKEMNLGTKAIVLTASSDTRLSFELARDFGVSDYISKDSDNFVKNTISSIQETKKHIKINYPDDNVRFLSNLHGGIDRHIWLSNATSLLESSVNEMSKFFSSIVESIYPAAFPNNSSGLYIDQNSSTINGVVWSFKLGKAVKILIFKKGQHSISGDILIDEEYHNLRYIVSESSKTYEEMFNNVY